MKRAGCAALLASLSLGGCGSQAPQVVTRIRLVEPRIPPALLVCPAAPVVPAATRQSQVASYVAELWRAHQVCRDHLVAVAHTLRALPGNTVTR